MAACAVVEVSFAAYEIHKACKRKRDNRLSKREFQDTVATKVVTTATNVGESH